LAVFVYRNLAMSALMFYTFEFGGIYTYVTLEYNADALSRIKIRKNLFFIRSLCHKMKPVSRLSLKKRLAYYLFRTPVNLCLRILYSGRYFGYNNAPRCGGVVVICNHQSHFDPPLLAGGLRRRLNFLARKSLFQSKRFAKAIDILDAIPLDQEGFGFEGIKETFKRLRGGEMVLIFPEGGRTWDGSIAPFIPNSLSIAQRSKCTILPAALAGCYEAFPRTHKLPKPWGKIRVIYGKPIPYEDIKDLSEEELRFLCEKRVAELYHSIR
jgi:1-acyl-sn-glycerol-3-phosphate acyltransferase